MELSFVGRIRFNRTLRSVELMNPHGMWRHRIVVDGDHLVVMDLLSTQWCTLSIAIDHIQEFTKHKYTITHPGHSQ